MVNILLGGSVGDVKNLFPTKIHFLIFIGYMTLFINQGILITASKDNNNRYHYNTTTVVMFTESVKLVVACILQLRESSVSEFFSLIKQHIKVLSLYMIPAFLYCLYNNLAFVNLGAYDPTSYFLLLQFRVVVTGVIFQILFSKQLSRVQWLSLILLTVGCIIKQLSVGSKTSAINFKLDHNLLLILVQVFCSCFAGVYNEYLLKGRSGEAPLMIQNVFMYIDSIFCNLVVLTYRGSVKEAFSSESIQSILTIIVISIIINNAAIGIVTSLFLKKLNSILKTFASALELMFTALLSWLLFGIPVTFLTFIALAIVTYAILLYSGNPVDNTQKPGAPRKPNAETEESQKPGESQTV